MAEDEPMTPIWEVVLREIANRDPLKFEQILEEVGSMSSDDAQVAEEAFTSMMEEWRQGPWVIIVVPQDDGYRIASFRPSQEAHLLYRDGKREENLKLLVERKGKHVKNFYQLQKTLEKWLRRPKAKESDPIGEAIVGIFPKLWISGMRKAVEKELNKRDMARPEAENPRPEGD